MLLSCRMTFEMHFGWSDDIILFPTTGVGCHSDSPAITYEALRPTYTHEAICKLVQLGYLKHVISQNTDGLHRLSGIPVEQLSELHGRNRTGAGKTGVGVVGWMGEWVDEWMNGWVSEWMSKWVGGWMGGWMSECVGEKMSEWVAEWVGKWMSEWVGGWVGGWVDEWMGEWVDEWMGGWVG